MSRRISRSFWRTFFRIESSPIFTPCLHTPRLDRLLRKPGSLQARTSFFRRGFLSLRFDLSIQLDVNRKQVNYEANNVQSCGNWSS